MKLSVLYLSCSVMFGISSVQAVYAQAESASTEVIETCPLPEKPSIPNGLKSTEEDMLEAQKNIKDYIAKGNAVLACLDELKETWGETASEEQQQINNLFYDKIVDDMEATGELFNSAVRAYKGRRE